MVAPAARVIASGLFPRGDIWNNVWHVDLAPVDSPLTQAAANLIANQFTTFYTSVLAVLCESGTSLAEISVQDLNQDGSSPWFFSSTVTPTTGTVMPQILACVLTLKNSAITGPSVRGRCYLPMTRQEALANNGAVSTSVRSTILTAVDTLGLNLDTNTVSLGIEVFSRKLGTVTSVDLAEIDSNPDTQRGRQNRAAKTRSTGPVSFAGS